MSNEAEVTKLMLQFISTASAVVVPLVVALWVHMRGVSDRRLKLSIEMDREWNSKTMIDARVRVDKLIQSQSRSPALDEDHYAEWWAVLMFFQRCIALSRAGEIDQKLYAAVLEKDLAGFAKQIEHKWPDSKLDLYKNLKGAK